MKSIKTEIGDFTGKHYEGRFNRTGYDLTSLEGAPRIVDGYFDCSNNQLTSLEKAPEIIRGDFWCIENNFESLKGLLRVWEVSFTAMKG
jgi:hypothetical protein